MTVWQMLHSMPSRELSEWQAVARLEAEEQETVASKARADANAKRGLR